MPKFEVGDLVKIRNLSEEEHEIEAIDVGATYFELPGDKVRKYLYRVSGYWWTSEQLEPIEEEK